MQSAVAARGRPETREALLDAVDALLAERGWTACSLQAVARRAGLTTGAVYSTFGSRGALFAAAMLRRTPEIATLPEGEPDLRRAVTAYARKFHALSQSTALVTTQLDLLRMGAADPSLAEGLRAANADILTVLAAALRPRLARADRANADALALRMLAALQGLTLQQYAMNAPLPQQVFVDGALAAVGLPPKPVRKGAR